VHRVRREYAPQIRLLRHAMRRGQSAALHTGVVAARADWIATLDGDGQNDPADIPKLLSCIHDPFDAAPPRLVMGHRRARQDTWARRLASRFANAVRRRMLNDATPDTGCGIKIMHRQTFLQLPVFNHMHRFLPALFLRAGAKVVSVPVHHRPRAGGQSKYGITDRLWVGIVDIFGVRWLMRRAPLLTTVREE
jgi:dolichol-phosphate mannosyltransferase